MKPVFFKSPLELTDDHVKRLSNAEFYILRSDYAPYLDLKGLLKSKNDVDQKQFQKVFARYYGLRASGEWRKKFFKILRRLNQDSGKLEPGKVIKQIGVIGGKRNPYSYASKLVAILDESKPIYDRHVRSFFGRSMSTKSPEKWFVEFLDHVSESYREWAKDKRVKPILHKLGNRDKELKRCHVVRKLDFLVWKAGSLNALEKSP